VIFPQIPSFCTPLHPSIALFLLPAMEEIREPLFPVSFPVPKKEQLPSPSLGDLHTCASLFFSGAALFFFFRRVKDRSFRSLAAQASVIARLGVAGDV